jgi:hypothetical protein
MRRPIDCSPDMITAFMETVLENGEVPKGNLERGIPAAEMLFFSVLGNTLVGVSAVRYTQFNFHRHLFIKAGVPEMFNPYSAEACWLSVLKEYRGIGAWSEIFKIRREYLKDRPAHAIHRAGNDLVADPAKNMGYLQVGSDFIPETAGHPVRLIVSNHDPVFDPNKRLIYC